ncbi:rhomboid family intramembrane serine protease [Chitinophaga agrisoli]|uniref:Rhomboid family intramembrane serine protease n=1 Tax=Chitinophaga agrisoli TaxID=2607653 RepID=A0A5B2VMP9_9BACT|nr:rhomboid family intramembrane serine protease [Chitinophaga agrisoli]KAA2239968.1 rhomboid family intramembrane serine protease [Chitinophaga agrisoli]
MGQTGFISIILVLANVIISYKGFKSTAFYDKYNFQVDRILINREYIRLVSSGFLHVSWMHLIFNMMSLCLFSGAIEMYLGSARYLIIYFASLVGGDLLSLFIHRNHGDYSSVGASGAISGVIFASIALFPDMGVGFFFLPVFIPGWLYGVGYVLYSIYSIRSKRHNIGHEAHLGGAMIGLIVAVILHPVLPARNYVTIVAILLPGIFFIYMIVTRPHFLLIDNYFFRQHQPYMDIDHRYNMERSNQQKQVDMILEKIHKKGMASLTPKEKELLERYSQQV